MPGGSVRHRRAESDTGRSGRAGLSGYVGPSLLLPEPVVTWLVTLGTRPEHPSGPSRGAAHHASGDLHSPVTNPGHDVDGPAERLDISADRVQFGDPSVLDLGNPRLRDAH